VTSEPATGIAGSGGAGDGIVLESARVADDLAIQHLAAAYAQPWTTATGPAGFHGDEDLDPTPTVGCVLA
jgi:hypothetical protein